MIAAIVLAAGQGTRFGAADVPSKLLARRDGRPLVRHVALAALASGAAPVRVVTGHAEAAVRAALEGLDVAFIANPAFAEGLAASLRRGVDGLASDIAGALILLGDMPSVRPATLDTLIAAFEATPDVDAVIPVYRGRRGNPVLIGRALFDAVARLEGDSGARSLLREAGRRVSLCDVEDAGIIYDIDHPEDLTRG